MDEILFALVNMLTQFETPRPDLGRTNSIQTFIMDRAAVNALKGESTPAIILSPLEWPANRGEIAMTQDIDYNILIQIVVRAGTMEALNTLYRHPDNHNIYRMARDVDAELYSDKHLSSIRGRKPEWNNMELLNPLKWRETPTAWKGLTGCSIAVSSLVIYREMASWTGSENSQTGIQTPGVNDLGPGQVTF